MIERICGWSPDVFAVVYALARDHDDAVLLEKILISQCSVMLDLFDVDDGAVMTKSFVQHSNQRGTAILDAAQIDDFDEIGGGVLDD